MAHFEIRIDSPLSATEAWSRVLDLRAHTAVIPLTTVTGDHMEAAELAPGSRFNARTGLGPLGFDDPMVVDEVEQPHGDSPGRARIRKEGSLIRGVIDLTVTPRTTGSVIVWRQDITVRHLPAVADPLAATVAKVAYGTTVKRLLARS